MMLEIMMLIMLRSFAEAVKAVAAVAQDRRHDSHTRSGQRLAVGADDFGRASGEADQVCRVSVETIREPLVACFQTLVPQISVIPSRARYLGFSPRNQRTQIRSGMTTKFVN